MKYIALSIVCGALIITSVWERSLGYEFSSIGKDITAIALSIYIFFGD